MPSVSDDPDRINALLTSAAIEDGYGEPPLELLTVNSSSSNGHAPQLTTVVNSGCPRPIAFGDLARKHPHLRRTILDGLLRTGEIANIVSHTKIGKSWLATLLLLSVATGRKWLDRFDVSAGRVLLIDNELHPETIVNRVHKVADALMIPRDQYADNLEVISLRGRLRDVYGLLPMLSNIEPETYQLIVLDAWYRILPPKTSENDNAQIAQIYTELDVLADLLKCALVCIHHTSKGLQTDKRATDVGAGAGSQSRASDTQIVLREHEDADVVVMDAIPRSFPPPDRVALRWDFPVWTLAEDVDPSLLKGRKTGAEERQDEKDDEGMKTLIDVLRQWNRDTDGEPTPNRITEKSPFGRERTRNLLSKLLHTGDVTRSPVTVKGNRTHEYALSK